MFLPCLIHVELLRAVSGLRTSVSVTWQRTCCLDTTRGFLFPLDQTGPGLKDSYLWTGEVLRDVSTLKACQQISLQQINCCLCECVCVCVLCRGLALLWQTDTTSLWASAFWDVSTIIELCHGWTAHRWHVTNKEFGGSCSKTFFFSLSLSLHPLMITQTEANLQSKFIDAPPLTRLS